MTIRQRGHEVRSMTLAAVRLLAAHRSRGQLASSARAQEVVVCSISATLVVQLQLACGRFEPRQRRGSSSRTHQRPPAIGPHPAWS